MIKICLISMLVCCMYVGLESEAFGGVDNSSGLNSNKTALIIIDIQNDYFPGGKNELSGSVEAGRQAKKILNMFRSNSLPVIHIQHEMMGENPPFFAPGSKGQKIHDCVLPLAGETVFVKQNVSSFEQTPLLDYLKKHKIEQLVVTGMQTNACVAATIKDAIKYEFSIIALKDTIAAVDKETHNKALLKFEAMDVKLMTAENFTSAFSK